MRRVIFFISHSMDLKGKKPKSFTQLKEQKLPSYDIPQRLWIQFRLLSLPGFLSFISQPCLTGLEKSNSLRLMLSQVSPLLLLFDTTFWRLHSIWYIYTHHQAAPSFIRHHLLKLSLLTVFKSQKYIYIISTWLLYLWLKLRGSLSWKAILPLKLNDDKCWNCSVLCHPRPWCGYCSGEKNQIIYFENSVGILSITQV